MFLLYIKKYDRLTMEQGSNSSPTECDGNDMTEILFSKLRSELVVCFHPTGGQNVTQRELKLQEREVTLFSLSVPSGSFLKQELPRA